jgi:hypothetical protein
VRGRDASSYSDDGPFAHLEQDYWINENARAKVWEDEHGNKVPFEWLSDDELWDCWDWCVAEDEKTKYSPWRKMRLTIDCYIKKRNMLSKDEAYALANERNGRGLTTEEYRRRISELGEQRRREAQDGEGDGE